MKIKYTYKEIAEITEGTILQENAHLPIENIVYDSRKISFGDVSLFLCLTSKNNDGHEYIADAYQRGVRNFLIEKEVDISDFPEATFLEVPNVLSALQKWASHHRGQFDIPVIGITGSAGKTIVKEWLYHFLLEKYNVARSPKSYNSQLGVALSLFEIDSETEIALIEAGISLKGEMQKLKKIIQPTIGVYTAFTNAHRANFANEREHFEEKIQLFSDCETVYTSGSLEKFNFHNLPVTFSENKESVHDLNLTLCQLIAERFDVPAETIERKSETMPNVALRMETFEGKNNNTILLDAYNMNFDGLEQALAQQTTLASSRERFLFLSRDAYDSFLKDDFDRIINQFRLQKRRVGIEELVVFSSADILSVDQIKESSLLFKGSHPQLKKLAGNFKARKHSTRIEISLSAFKNNLKVWQDRLPPNVKTMAMVKASAYGAELTKLGGVLSQQKIDYLGVAYVDEGVELRKKGVTLPILVMNSDKSSWLECVQHNLEPAVFSFEQMEELVKELILMDIQNFPVHLKFDTGMNRLGFFQEDLSNVINFLKTQPELKVKSVFSHLADANNLEDQSFTLQQLREFQSISEKLQNHLPYPIMRHILNTDGLSNYPEFGFDMVRLGIGLYGVSSRKDVLDKLKPVLSWKSNISQIKKLKVGDFVGYGRTYQAPEPMSIAIIPVGYADGYKRALSNGKGGVYINSVFCPTIGRVCMDMTMVDISGNDFKAGDEVEIIGENQNIDRVANLCETIPYEIMTGLSTRMPRIFVDDVD